MMTHSHHHKSVGLLILRLAVAVVFVYHGYGKLMNIEQTTGFFGGMLNFPMPAFFAYFVGLVELIGGLCIGLGVMTCYAAITLGVTMVVALLTAHLKMPYSAAELPIVLLGALCALGAMGGGKYSLWKGPGCMSGCCGKSGAMGCGGAQGTAPAGGSCGCGGNGACGCGNKGLDMKK